VSVTPSFASTRCLSVRSSSTAPTKSTTSPSRTIWANWYSPAIGLPFSSSTISTV
jgi:hypothetical protein